MSSSPEQQGASSSSSSNPLWAEELFGHGALVAKLLGADETFSLRRAALRVGVSYE
jgi:hypothetical protein